MKDTRFIMLGENRRMTNRSRSRRSALLEAADLRELSWWTRLKRMQFRRTRLQSVPPTAQTVDPRAFEANSEGSGIFGQWTLDHIGLPAYDYTFDQYADARARYPNSENLDRRDHWHQVGNRRITALASNDGTVQVYLGDRGGILLNKFEAWDSERLSGGLVGLLSRALLALVRLVTGLFRQRPPAPQPYYAASAALWEAANQPRATLPLEHLTRLKEESYEPLVRSYDLLSRQDEPLMSEPQPLPVGRNREAVRCAYAGGYSYIDDGSEIWATAYRYRPDGAQTRRRFGMGYFETEMTYRDLRVTRRVFAPEGDIPALRIDVWVENLGTQARQVRHHEYWDVNVHHLRVEWLRGGSFGAVSDEQRRQLNREFTNSITYRAEQGMILFRQEAPPDAPPPDQPAPINWYPDPIFLADLDGQPDAHFIHKAAFFGAGGARRPEGLRRETQPPFRPDSPLEPMPYCMVLRRSLTVHPGETRRLSYAYGMGQPEAVLPLLAVKPPRDLFYDTQQTWREDIAHFSTGEDPVLQREAAWHSYNLLSALIYNAFHGVHHVPQGSAYLFLHGSDGVPRDQALFSLPMVYLDPGLAREMLRLIMRLTDRQTGQIPYAFTGHGYLSNGLGMHSSPSDLDLFFLLALTEYLGATRDFGFLDEEVPFYPPDKPALTPSTRVIEHVRLALKHLFEYVGTGENGLIRVRSGDWSDSIVLETALKDGLLGAAYLNSKQHGESVPNTQMALYVLPLLANLLRDFAPDVTREIEDGRLKRLEQAVQAQWNEKGWYNRAILRGMTNQPVPIDGFTLEAQVWALLSGAAKDGGHEAALIERIEAALDGPSPIGASLVPGGMTWPAISQLLTWAYARTGRRELAWRSLNRHTFAVHAQQYPAIWFGIWSAPDGINGLNAEHPGGTWSTPLTPMTDFPVMNANPDAMALLGLIRTCGIEPAPGGDGLVIRPAVPRRRFVLDMSLLRLEVDGAHIRGEYRAQAGGELNLYIYPQGSLVPTVLPLVFRAGERVRFQI